MADRSLPVRQNHGPGKTRRAQSNRRVHQDSRVLFDRRISAKFGTFVVNYGIFDVDRYDKLRRMGVA